MLIIVINFLDFCFSLSYLQSPGLQNCKKEEEDKNKSEFTCIHQPVRKRLCREERSSTVTLLKISNILWLKSESYQAQIKVDTEKNRNCLYWPKSLGFHFRGQAPSKIVSISIITGPWRQAHCQRMQTPLESGVLVTDRS